MTDFAVVGAGGFGREAIDIYQNARRAGSSLRLWGVVDDAPTQALLTELRRREVRYLGSISEAIEEGILSRFAIAIGDPADRARVAQQICAYGEPVCLVDPRSSIADYVDMAGGVIVSAGAIISTNVSLGTHAHVNSGAIVGHDVEVGSGAAISPGAVISGHCMIGDGALIGAGATLLEGVQIGGRAVIGAGACVVRDVPPGSTVKGVPAK